MTCLSGRWMMVFPCGEPLPLQTEVISDNGAFVGSMPQQRLVMRHIGLGGARAATGVVRLRP